MTTKMITALAAAALLLPAVSFGAAMEVYKAKEIEPYKAKDVEPRKAKEIEVFKGRTVKRHKGTKVKAEDGKGAERRRTKGAEIESPREAGQAHLFTKKDFEEMRQNDVKAGRTRDSMGQGKSGAPVGGQNPNPYNDPYNKGGWNYNTNQSASPIWNPNSQ